MRVLVWLLIALFAAIFFPLSCFVYVMACIQHDWWWIFVSAAMALIAGTSALYCLRQASKEIDRAR